MTLKKPSVKKPEVTRPEVTPPEADEIIETIDDESGFLEEKRAVVPEPPAVKPKKPKLVKPDVATVGQAADPVAPVPEVKGQLKLPRSDGAQEGWNVDDDEEGGGDHGLKYIRMLNLVGLVRPVDVDHVPDRLCDGYFFIVDEPAVPRVTGDPQRCDGEAEPGFTVKPYMDGGRPTSMAQAMKMWLSRMQQDRARFQDRDDLLWSYVDMLRDRMFRRKQNENMDDL